MLTPETLTTAFIDAGIDTPEKVAKLLTTAGAQMRRAATVLAIDALNGEQSAAIATINARRATLQAEANALTAHIIAAVTPQS